MMQKVGSLIIMFFLIFSFNTHAQIVGIIKDKKNGLPISGASVYISDERKGTSTDDNGHFSISHISEGNHLIEISHIGYASLAEQITVHDETKFIFELTQTVLENNAVVVTGVTKATQIKKIPFQVSVFKKDDLLKSASTNIIESIGKLPGVSTVSTGPAISKPQIRGLGYNRVITIHDGVRQEGQQWGDEHGIEIDESGVQSIEVLKGPASLIYGSDAMAGVINIMSNVPAPQNTIRTSVTSSYFTNNHLRSFSGDVSGNNNGFQFRLHGSVKEAGDYRNKYDGYVFNSKFNEQSISGNLGFNSTKGYSHIILSSYSLNAGMVEGARNEDGDFIKEMPGGVEDIPTKSDFLSTSPWLPYQSIKHQKAVWDNSLRIGGSRLTLNLGFQQNKRAEYGNPDNASERELDFLLQTFTYNTQLHLPEMIGWKQSVGINGMHQKNSNYGVAQLIPDYRLIDAGIFYYIQKEIQHWNVSGGLRFDHRKIRSNALMNGTVEKNSAFEKDYGNYSGSIGVAKQLNKTFNLKLNAARAFRAPSLAELGTNGAHEGTIRYEYGDNTLKSETSTQFDAGIEMNTEHVSINFSGYVNRFDNFIFYRKLQNIAGTDSIIINDGKALTAFTFSQQKANMAGLEANIDFHPHPLDWLHIENSFSMVTGKFSEAQDGSLNMPFIPAPRWISEIRAEFSYPNKPISRFYTHLEIENTFQQNRSFAGYNTETSTPGYTLVNAEMGITLNLNKQPVNIYILANNLMDIAYQNHLSRLKYTDENPVTDRQGVFNMGINFALRIYVPMLWRW